ncbi:MAG: XDD4 family exosortase-dependent surface protein [Phycisphaerales bacterium]
MAGQAHATTVQFSSPSGLAARATFTLLDAGHTLQIALQNTSFAMPDGIGSGDRLLTSIAFNMGGVNIQGTGSSVFTGANSHTLNFSVGGVSQDYGSNFDVSGEWGYGNNAGVLTGFAGMTNLVSTLSSGTTRFEGANLDGPEGLNGPQAGLISEAGLDGLDGTGAIQDEIIIRLNLDGTLSDLSFLNNGVVVEFGSDYAFLTVIPLPGAAGMAGLGLALVGSRRRR